MKNQCWFAVDGHGNEYVFNEKPVKDFPNLDLRVKWGQRWAVGTSCDPSCWRYGVLLPKGTIKQLTGSSLTYNDNPISLEFEDYGNYIETRPEVLSSDTRIWHE